jgi:hypothetical protein
MADQYKCSQDTKDRIEAFNTADKQFKEAWGSFEDTHATELAQLEKLRDDRNAKLDEAKRSLRAELEMIDEMRLTFTAGPFKVQKRFSDYYIPEKLVSMLEDCGLYESAINAKIIAVKIETVSFDEVTNFLKLHGVAKQFECCEDGKHFPGTISGPKPVPPLGAELKKE